MTKKYILRLRSSDGEYLRPNEYHSERDSLSLGNMRFAKLTLMVSGWFVLLSLISIVRKAYEWQTK